MKITTTPNKGQTHLTHARIASTLGISVPGVRKLVDAAVLSQPASPAMVAEFATRPRLGISDGEITVLRTGPAEEVFDPERRFMGYDASMTDQEANRATTRWWRCDPDRVLSAGLFLVTISTIPVAVFEVNGLLDTLGHGTEVRHALDARLLARFDATAGHTTFREPSDRITAEDMTTIMGSRVYTTSGGPVAYLGDES